MAMVNVRMPNPAIFGAMGLDNVIKMVQEVYKLLGKSSISHMFPENEEELMASAAKSALFWATALGGPPLFEEKHGPPMMRARHTKFMIDETARAVWVSCWYPVLAVASEKFSFPKEHIDSFTGYIEDFSTWMVNC